MFKTRRIVLFVSSLCVLKHYLYVSDTDIFHSPHLFLRIFTLLEWGSSNTRETTIETKICLGVQAAVTRQW